MELSLNKMTFTNAFVFLFFSAKQVSWEYLQSIKL